MSIPNLIERSNPEDMEGDFEAGGAGVSGKLRLPDTTRIIMMILLCSVVSFGLGWFLGQGSAGPVVGSGTPNASAPVVNTLSK
jgi:hypothetical protein